MSSWRFPYPLVKKAGKIRPIRQEGRNDVADCRSAQPRCEHIRAAPSPQGMHWDTCERIASQPVHENEERQRILTG